MTYLLDISTLLAWLNAAHTANDDVLRWEKGKAIAVCPLTELGFLRVSCNAYGANLPDAREALARWKTKRQPKWLACDIPTGEGTPAPTWKHTTDFYLANLAGRHGMKLATLDAHLAHPAAEKI